MGGAQSRPGRGGEEKNPFRESNRGRQARSLVTILTELLVSKYSKLDTNAMRKCEWAVEGQAPDLDDRDSIHSRSAAIILF
jgi:hypothetical protein